MFGSFILVEEHNIETAVRYRLNDRNVRMKLDKSNKYCTPYEDEWNPWRYSYEYMEATDKVFYLRDMLDDSEDITEEDKPHIIKQILDLLTSIGNLKRARARFFRRRNTTHGARDIIIHAWKSYVFKRNLKQIKLYNKKLTQINNGDYYFPRELTDIIKNYLF